MAINFIFIQTIICLYMFMFGKGSETKVILLPEILIKDNYGFKSKQLRQIIVSIEEHYELIIEKWNEIHG